MSVSRSGDDARHDRLSSSADKATADERDLGDEIEVAIDQVRADEAFTERAAQLLERDGELLRRLAE